MHLFIVIIIDQLLIKFNIQSIIFRLIYRFFRLCKSFLYNILLKILVRSNIREKIFLL